MSTIAVHTGPIDGLTSGAMAAIRALEQAVNSVIGAGEVNTNIATVGNGTLTAAAIVGGVITRSGSTNSYTDTTDTATNIIAAMPTNSAVGESWELTIKNTVAFAQTLSAGAGVTLSGQTIVPHNSALRCLVTYTGTGAVTILGLFAVTLAQFPPDVSTALNTVGAGTVTGAGIVGAITTRGGAQSGAAFTDTTDTAANIIAAFPNINIGQSWEYTYENTTNAAATITGGTGVTVSGVTVVPPGQAATFLVTFSAAGAVTMVGFMMGPIAALPVSQMVLNANAGAQTAAVGDITGAQTCFLKLTSIGAANYTTRTAAQMFADTPNAYIGMTWTVCIKNTNAGTTTVVGGSNVTVNGTATIAQNTARLFQATFVDATHVTLESFGVTATI